MKLGTLDKSGLPHNPAVELDLHAEGDDLVSKSLLLVADAIDDQAQVDGVADDQRNDRTFVIAQGGQVQVSELKIGGTTYPLDYRMPGPAARTVEVSIVILRDAVFGGTEVIPQAKVEEFWRIAHERYAQVGVSLVIKSIEIKSPPVGVNLSGTTFNMSDSITGIPLSAGARKIIETYGAYVPKGNVNDIHVFYVPTIYLGTFLGRGYALADFLYTADEPNYINNIFIDGTMQNSPLYGYVAAHELGHLLLNWSHEDKSVNPPAAYPSWHVMWIDLAKTPQSGIIGSRRFLEADDHTINHSSLIK